MPNPEQEQIPIQPVYKPILCSPYEEPSAHWVYNTRRRERHPNWKGGGLHRATLAELEAVGAEVRVRVVDFHAEATSEKVAYGRFLDGRVSAVVGTHTHVSTADEQLLPGGTAYISDLGMTGPSDSVIGVEAEIVIRKFLTGMPERFETAKGRPRLQGAVVTVDPGSGHATAIERVSRFAS